MVEEAFDLWKSFVCVFNSEGFIEFLDYYLDDCVGKC